ncbi:MAG: DUF507 family protein [Candidatus Sumerlaeia bacterium]|nr:DUF507 family protein [Candidatus Sumerlaeia bacterium]
MRLSNDRIQNLARRMAKQMASRGAVAPRNGPDDLALFLARFLAYDQMKMEEVEKEAREFIARQRTLPPPGSGEYEAAFRNAREQIARKKGRVV